MKKNCFVNDVLNRKNKNSFGKIILVMKRMRKMELNCFLEKYLRVNEKGKREIIQEKSNNVIILRMADGQKGF